MLKLVATDIDGTLIPPGQKIIPQRVFDEVEKLIDSGVAFCFASGRQYENLKTIGAPLLDKAYFMCENGAALFSGGEPPRLISKTAMDRDAALEISRIILRDPDSEVFISGENTTYLCPKSGKADFIPEHIRTNNFQILQRPEDTPEPILKVSAFCKDAYVSLPILSPGWTDRFTVSIAGDQWVDFTTANKGTALEALCRHLSIDLDEVAAFGDNYNDIPMLNIVGRPYIMENADDELKRLFPNRCADVAEELKKIRLNCLNSR